MPTDLCILSAKRSESLVLEVVCMIAALSESLVGLRGIGRHHRKTSVLAMLFKTVNELPVFVLVHVNGANLHVVGPEIVEIVNIASPSLGGTILSDLSLAVYRQWCLGYLDQRPTLLSQLLSRTRMKFDRVCWCTSRIKKYTPSFTRT
jgi:hypothetical protein